MNDRPVNVLLIEDNPGDARLIKEFLAETESALFDLTWSDCLSKGLEHIATKAIDIILLDLQLPDSQGLETLVRVHTQAPEAPIVVLTGFDDETLAIKAVKEGVQDYLIKGQVDSNLLMRAMRYAIERKNTEKALRKAHAELEVRVEERTAELAEVNEGLRIEIIERRKAEDALRKAHAELERRVEERTAELKAANDKLCQQIAERMEAQEALKTAHQQLQDIIEFLPDATFVIDREKRIIAWNRAIEEMTGIGASQMLGRGGYEYSVPFYGERRPILIDLILDPDEEIDGKYVNIDKRDILLAGESYMPALRGGEAYLFGTASVLRDSKGNIAGAIESIRDITDRKRSEKALEESERQLRFLSSRLLEAQEEERKRIARELHDSIGQSLAAVKFGLEHLLKTAKKARAETMVRSVNLLIPMVQSPIEDARRICMGLRPSILDDLGIIATLDWLGRDFRKTYPHIGVEERVEVEEEEIPDSLKIVIFRIVQEALSNIAKHSHADSVIITLLKTAGTMELSIKDNGRGFNLNEMLSKEASERGLGLAGMRERTEFSGGLFLIESGICAGTTIRTTWTFSREENEGPRRAESEKAGECHESHP